MEYYSIGILNFKYTNEFKENIEYTITSYLDDKSDKTLNTQMDELEERYKPKSEYKLDSRVLTLPTKLRWIDRIRFSAEKLCNIRGNKLELHEEYQRGYMEGFSDGKTKTIFWDTVAFTVIYATYLLIGIFTGFVHV